MKVSSYPHGRGVVVVPRDAIVEGECSDLRRAVLEALEKGSSHIVLDLAEVPFVDSAGLELLCDLQAVCANGGANLRLASIEEVCREILRITDLEEQFQVFGSVEEAAKSVG